MADTPEETATELKALRERLTLLQRLRQERGAVAVAARALLAKDSTHPRPRREVEKELETAEVWDLPMLEGEIAAAERAIAKLEATLTATLEGEPPLAILAACRLGGRKGRRLRQLIEQRAAAVTRITERRQAFDAAVASMRGPGEEREQLRRAIGELERLDKQIDRLGADVRQLQGIERG